MAHELVIHQLSGGCVQGTRAFARCPTVDGACDDADA